MWRHDLLATMKAFVLAGFPATAGMHHFLDMHDVSDEEYKESRGYKLWQRSNEKKQVELHHKIFRRAV